MKNIHVLPTEKPSRLYLTTHEYIFEEGYSLPTDECENKNIYITSNEEIKEGDWFYNIISLKPEPFKACENGNGYVNCNKYSHNRIDCKKIILTTDIDLIKDGVQGIDDDFLEWFVKNPSCERVEVKKGFADGTAWGYNFLDYKIIIPQEEPKQETPEEVAEIILANNIDGLRDALKDDDLFYFYKGVIQCYGEDMANWQQEQDKNKYSEKEVEIIIQELMNDVHCGDLCYGNNVIDFKLSPRQWFEQFKKR